MQAFLNINKETGLAYLTNEKTKEFVKEIDDNEFESKVSELNTCYMTYDIATDTFSAIPNFEENMRTKEEALQFLRDTDNYALRLTTGEAKPEDISSTYNMTFQAIMNKRIEIRNKLRKMKEKT